MTFTELGIAGQRSAAETSAKYSAIFDARCEEILAENRRRIAEIDLELERRLKQTPVSVGRVA